jgi:hypothetical protein
MSKISELFHRGKQKEAPPEQKPGEPRDLPYNPREFLVPATNPKSRTPPARLQFKCQQGHEHEVSKIIAAKQFPYYETPSDLLRHSLERHLKYLHTMGAPIDTEWLQTEAVIEVVREQQRQHHFETTLAEMEAAAQKSVEMGMRGEARLMVNKVMVIVAAMTDGRWKRKWQRVLRERFAHLEKPEIVGEVVGEQKELTAGGAE